MVVSVGGEVSLVMARKWDQWGKDREGDEEKKTGAGMSPMI